MQDELKSMHDNDVWDPIDLLDDFKQSGYKWLFKTKRESRDNVELFKARFIVIGFT